MFGLFFDCLEQLIAEEHGMEVWDVIIELTNQSLEPDGDKVRSMTTEEVHDCTCGRREQLCSRALDTTAAIMREKLEGKGDGTIRACAWSINRHYEDRLFFNLVLSAAACVGLSFEDLMVKIGYRFFDYIRSVQFFNSY
jgi:hypothetical protein